MSEEKRFAMRYSLKMDFDDGSDRFLDSEIKKDYLKEEDLGACDAIFFSSISFDDDGGVSYAFCSGNGRTKNHLNGIEHFKMWSTLSHHLCDFEDLLPWQKDIVSETCEKIRHCVASIRKETEHP